VRTLINIAVAAALAGCAGMDTWGVHSQGDLPVGDLSDEQVAQLKSAFSAGDPDLIATAARMAWDDPERAGWIANYASNLAPDRSAEIAAAVAGQLKNAAR
jgi:hypothetical protein